MTILVTVNDDSGNACFQLTIPDVKPEDVIAPGMATPGIRSVTQAVCKFTGIQTKPLK